MLDTKRGLPTHRPSTADRAGLLEQWKDRDRNNRRTAELRLVSPPGAPSFWELTLAGRVRHAAVMVVVTEYAAASAPAAAGWWTGPVYQIEMTPVGGIRPGLDAVVRAGLDAWAGLDAGRIPLPPPPAERADESPWAAR